MTIFLPEQHNLKRGIDNVMYDSAVVTIACSGWYRRADFNNWRMMFPGPAGWGQIYRDTEYGDVFIPYDGRGDEWEGADMEELPEDIYHSIGQVLLQAPSRQGIIRLKPVE